MAAPSQILPRMSEPSKAGCQVTTHFAAHIVMAVRYREGFQDAFPCYENVVLVCAETDDEALNQASQIGRSGAAIEGDDFHWNGRPARWEFVGVRKLIECRTPGSLENRISHGTELTYSQFTLESEAALARFANGDAVQLLCEE